MEYNVFHAFIFYANDASYFYDLRFVEQVHDADALTFGA